MAKSTKNPAEEAKLDAMIEALAPQLTSVPERLEADLKAQARIYGRKFLHYYEGIRSTRRSATLDIRAVSKVKATKLGGDIREALVGSRDDVQKPSVAKAAAKAAAAKLKAEKEAAAAAAATPEQPARRTRARKTKEAETPVEIAA
jgi:hypothetical protein